MQCPTFHYSARPLRCRIIRDPGQYLLSIFSPLAVLIPARDADSLGFRFCDAARALLVRLGVPPAAVDAEARAMADVAFGPTANRRVLGCLNEAANVMSLELESGRRTSTADLELFLSENIYAFTGYREPRLVVLDVFASSSTSSG